MAKRRIQTKLKRSEVRKIIRQLPGMISGRIPSRFGFHKIFWGAVAESLFRSIYDAYLDKSQGGADELGQTWPDLKQHTKAYKRHVTEGGTSKSVITIRNRNRSRDREGNRKGYGILTAAQYRLWRRIFGAIYHKNEFKMGDVAARVLAGQIAWTRLKKEGALTMWDTLGHRKLLILRSQKDVLFKSFTPGKFDPSTGYKKGNKNQVFIVNRGKVTIGTSVPHANYVSLRRPLWPSNIDEWLSRATEAGRDAVIARLEEVLED
jgi:hypothetical protein